ncbi:glycosyltransferase family 2 protein [Haloplanus natans]|uniref:glycosyltransferase family 2 protein n=1 Tax=Haloplanus natans TaxID=376171 RepID=UPI000B025026|nr:glycosyltransferase family 2 protein [Haloplanus natans]
MITPTFNESDYVESTLRSLAAQTYDNVELIVVDGNSADDTVEKIRRFEEEFQRVKILVNDPRVNQSFARNRGLMHANGEYIVFHDADDLSVPSRFERQVEFLESNPDVGAVGSSFYYINPNRNERTIRNRPTEHETIRKALARSCPIHIGSAMFRCEALAETHLFKSEYAEIYEILIDMAANGWKLRNLEEPLFVYRINEESISREGQFEQKWVLLKRNYQAVTRLGLSPLNLVLSLGWFVYMYSPPEMKRIVRQLFAPDDDQQLTNEQERILNGLLDDCPSRT